MQTDLLFERFDDLLATPDDVKRLEAAILRLEGIVNPANISSK